MAKLAVFYNHKLTGYLTKIFTGSYAYHVGWVCEDNDKFYDMNLIRRRRIWSTEKVDRDYLLFDFPLVNAEYLEFKTDTDTATYGFIDYVLFAIRPLYHLFGKSTRNANGVICSEMCNDDIIACGYKTPWSVQNEPPSPGDLAEWLNNIEKMQQFSDARKSNLRKSI